MKKNVLAALLIAAMAMAALTGCDSSEPKQDDSSSTAPQLEVLEQFGDLSASDAEYEPNGSYDKYTVIDYALEDAGMTVRVTASAKADDSEYYLEYAFFGDDQLVVCDNSGNISYDKSGFMADTTPGMLKHIQENAVWSAMPDSAPVLGTPSSEQGTSGDAQVSVNEPVYVPEYTKVTYDIDFLYDIESETITNLQQECSEKGTVVTLDYTAPAYAVNEILGQDLSVEKSVSVYLPYGYDESQQYDILYLLHGTGGDEKYWLLDEKTGIPTCNVLDNMIQQGICKPMIVAAPNFHSEIKGTDYKLTEEIIADYAKKVDDSYLKVKNDVWPEFFQYELRNDIIPLVETAYSTYAGGDVSQENLIATRGHRAFAGLSRGSMAVARSGLMGNADMISYFGSFSGVWAKFDDFKAIFSESGAFAQYPVRFWYNGNGTEDFSAEDHINFHNNVMAELSGKFVEGENYALIVKNGAAHAYENWIVDLYNFLLVSFKDS